MLRPAQWDAAHSPVHTRPQPPRSRPAPSHPPHPPRTSVPPPQPQRLPAQPAPPPPPAPVKVKQEEVSDPESERPLTPSPPLNMTPLPPIRPSAPQQPTPTPEPGPTPAAPLDVLQDPAYRAMVQEITAEKLRSVWRAAPGTPGKVHCILCVQMRDTGAMPAGREPAVLPKDTPDQTLNAHCVEQHKLVWETAIKSEIAERVQSAGEDEDMEEEDVDMDLEEGELR
ncbi:hypothetical protein AURDEDRAFT_158331 [Auricularia subglabra TFB-10046 SS5]|nr:hypothetical protein AURDEDRAFT_158331 [Auricularia subglabra TFB-10046 SS5]